MKSLASWTVASSGDVLRITIPAVPRLVTLSAFGEEARAALACVAVGKSSRAGTPSISDRYGPRCRTKMPIAMTGSH